MTRNRLPSLPTFQPPFPARASGALKSNTISGMESNEPNGISRWWRVAGGLSMNLALGTLYGWSVFVAPLESRFGWKRADTSMVFTSQ